MRHPRLLALASASGLAAILVTAPPAQAHEYSCSVRWASASQTYYHPLVWAPKYVNAIGNAAASIRTTDFDWNYSSSSATQWRDLASSDTSIAGQTSVTSDCANHRIVAVALYLNFPHLSNHTQDQIQCTAIHEFGHGAGLAHNTLTSIMNADHAYRCHNLLIKTVQSHDVSDLNAKY